MLAATQDCGAKPVQAQVSRSLAAQRLYRPVLTSVRLQTRAERDSSADGHAGLGCKACAGTEVLNLAAQHLHTSACLVYSCAAAAANIWRTTQLCRQSYRAGNATAYRCYKAELGQLHKAYV